MLLGYVLYRALGFFGAVIRTFTSHVQGKLIYHHVDLIVDLMQACISGQHPYYYNYAEFISSLEARQLPHLDWSYYDFNGYANVTRVNCLTLSTYLDTCFMC